MQVSAVDIRRDIYGQEEEKQEFKHGADWLSKGILLCCA
jgi:hypothetical protein